MKKIAIAILLLEGISLIIKKIRGVGGYTHTSTVSTPTNECNNPTGYETDSDLHIKQNTNAARFNLLAIRDLFVEFQVDVNRGAALRVLLDTIKAKTYFNLVKDFYYSATDVTLLLHKWDKAD